ncbi:diguanylate cyclase domain-containing protein [Nocardioides mangrovicus]
MALPYLPLTIAVTVLGTELMRSSTNQRSVLLLVAALVAMMLLRQFLTVRDNQRLVTALADARDELHHQAMHDALTGLPNRVLFAARLDRALSRARRDVAVLYCDLDGFKPVNDEHGHGAGDVLLRVVAERLGGCVRSCDTVARLGGDEFALLLEDGGHAERVVARIEGAFGEPFDIGGILVEVAVSVGVAHHRLLVAQGDEPTPALGHAELADDLMRRADAAMYAQKTARRAERGELSQAG